MKSQLASISSKGGHRKGKKMRSGRNMVILIIEIDRQQHFTLVLIPCTSVKCGLKGTLANNSLNDQT
eukprot:5095210-Amphidinium_carterae.1